MRSGLTRFYHGAALLLANTVVVFALANAIAWLGLWLAGAFPPAPGSPAYEAARSFALDLPVFRVDRFFPGLDRDQIATLIHESFARPPLYDPFTQFRERPYHGQFVNVDANGFRHGRGQNPWPPDPQAENVFVFGGSTTFGMGIPDDQTIPSHLSDLLARRGAARANVYNFGAGYYFSTQERTQLEQLLLAGVVPNVAVFVDGCNDFFHADGLPALTARLANLLSEPVHPPPHPWIEAVRGLPVGIAATRLQAWATRRPVQSAAVAPPIADGARPPHEAETIAGVIARYRRNKRMIEALAAAYGVRPIFVWQPMPTYRYDLKFHAFHPDGFGRVEITRAGYPEMARIAKTEDFGSDFVWCADIQEGRHEELYIDLVHYSPKMARRVAGCIAKGMRKPRTPLIR
jgi:lysophospholipase L1-like esterase